MILYHMMIELKSDARALAFGAAVGAWMDHLQAAGLIGPWRLMRRKLGLASGCHPDFLLEIEVANLSALEKAFLGVAGADDAALRKYEQMHLMIASAEVGLYRPWPDAGGRERVALI